MDAWFSRMVERRAPDPDLMLLAFFTQLRTDFVAAVPDLANPPPEVNGKLVERVSQLLGKSEEWTWSWAYEIELLLVHLKPRAQLAYNMEAAIAEAEGRELANAKTYRAQCAAIMKPADPQQPVLGEREIVARMRALLTAVRQDLQWFYQNRIVIRKEASRGIWRLFRLGIYISFIVAFPFICFVFERWTGLRWFSMLIPGYPNFGIYTAMSFGLLGGYFSLLLSARQQGESKSIEEAQNRYSSRLLAVRAAVGMFGAVIVYYILSSEVLGKGGGLVPDFGMLQYKETALTTIFSGPDSIPDAAGTVRKFTVLLPSKDWSLLVVWSFLAGFSEMLVQNTLTRIEDSFSRQRKEAAAATPAPAQQKPTG